LPQKRNDNFFFDNSWRFIFNFQCVKAGRRSKSLKWCCISQKACEVSQSYQSFLCNETIKAIHCLVPRRQLLLPCLIITIIIFYKCHSVFEPNVDTETTSTISESAVTYNVSEVKSLIEWLNDLQLINNEETFGPLPNDSIIIVVQVHKRITYLKHLIDSLAIAKDISKTLLVFSHDVYDEEINELVQSIEFCMTTQIFYPFSIQTHPYEFPGTDPKDCRRDIKKDKALAMKCQNAESPDVYGHYREASFAQIKHHWWWKAYRIFDHLEFAEHFTGLVLFLEEDHYLTEDFLHILALMAKQECLSCNILSLGTYGPTIHSKTFDKVSRNQVSEWLK